MKHVIVSYTINPESVDENARLVRAVCEELKEKKPRGIRYMSLLAEGGRFVHIFEQDEGAPALTDFAAFQEFQREFANRCLTRRFDIVSVVGSYAMLRDAA